MTKKKAASKENQATVEPNLKFHEVIKLPNAARAKVVAACLNNTSVGVSMAWSAVDDVVYLRSRQEILDYYQVERLMMKIQGVLQTLDYFDKQQNAAQEKGEE